MDVTLDDFQTCLLGESGRLRCFGNFSWLDEWLASDVPVWVLSWFEYDSPIEVVTNGGSQLCVVLADGRHGCAQHNLGLGELDEAPESGRRPLVRLAQWLLLADGRVLDLAGDTPTELPRPAGFTQLALGSGHMCGRTELGTVACVGSNSLSVDGDPDELSGQLGVPGIGSSEVFVELPLTEVAGVTAGTWQTCAWFESGEYACWGMDNGGTLGNGQLGDVIGDDETLDDLPRYALDGAVVQMAASERATCARLEDGGVRCWGSGAFVQLTAYLSGEEGSVPDPMVEPRIPLPEPAVDLDLADSHACAVGESGAVYCWGYAPSEYRETNNFAGFENGGYLDPSTGMVRPLVLEDPETCAAQ